MRKIGKISPAVICTLLLCILIPSFPSAAKISSEDEAYLRGVMEDTWYYISFFVMPDTGFPMDGSVRSRKTNTTNIGLYLASIAVAHNLGLVETDDAVKRITTVLDSLDKIENWNCLYNNWLDVYGQTNAAPGLNNISDYNKLPAGIIMVSQEFPEFRKRCNAFLEQIPWDLFYNENTGHLLYEFDIIQKTTKTPAYISRGEDKLLGAFFMVASGKVPASSWDYHRKDKETIQNMSYFRPGWQGGGLFMQYICGIFLDETATELGYSSVNFAYAQILYAKEIGYPVWGWSAAQAPDGRYLGWDQITDEIVTPHASVLAIEFFPEEVVRNLRKLQAMGARDPFVAPSGTYRFGFKDSVNVETGEVCPDYLLLDQAMIFLSLANFLEDNVVRRIFDKSPMVRYGYEVLETYHVTEADKQKFREYIRGLQ
jgi:hypothetical protein